jgi:hypothetical protein
VYFLRPDRHNGRLQGHIKIIDTFRRTMSSSARAGPDFKGQKYQGDRWVPAILDGIIAKSKVARPDAYGRSTLATSLAAGAR